MEVLLSGEAGRTLYWHSRKECEIILLYLFSHRSWVIEFLGEPLRELKVLHDNDGKHWDREVNAKARKLRDALELRMLVVIQVADLHSKKFQVNSV